MAGPNLTEARRRLAAAGVTVRGEETLDAFAEPVPFFRVAGRDAARAWRALAEEAEDLGAWPVLAPREDALELAEDFADRFAPVPDAETWLRGRLQEFREYGGDAAALDLDLSPRPTMPPGPLPGAAELRRGLLSLRDVPSGKERGEMGLALAPVRHPWQVPLALRFGGFNDCPPPEAQAAMLRRWFERFGAVPALFTRDVLECAVAWPPDEGQAAALAVEQYLFCPDLVDQGVETVEALAELLPDVVAWYFWWD